MGIEDFSFVAFFLLGSSVQSGISIHCYIDNSTDSTSAKVIDCSSLGIQREELYCRNTTTDHGEIHRSCVAMSWYDSNWEELGCHREQGITRCTCSTDLCNAPFESSSAPTPATPWTAKGYLGALALVGLRLTGP